MNYWTKKKDVNPFSLAFTKKQLNIQKQCILLFLQIYELDEHVLFVVDTPNLHYDASGMLREWFGDCSGIVRVVVFDIKIDNLLFVQVI